MHRKSIATERIKNLNNNDNNKMAYQKRRPGALAHREKDCQGEPEPQNEIGCLRGHAPERKGHPFCLFYLTRSRRRILFPVALCFILFVIALSGPPRVTQS